MQDNWFFIINPVSGFQKGGKIWKTVEPMLKGRFNYEHRFTEYSKHATLIIKEAIAKGYRKFVGIGGDGTLHDMVNGVMTQSFVPTQEICLGIISVGTGNDWIKTYSFPKDPAQAVEAFLKENTFLQDIGKLTYTNDGGERSVCYFDNMAGVGLDAVIVENTAKKGSLLGPFIYLKGMISTLLTYGCVDLRIKIGDQIIESPSYLTLAAINKYAGGGMKFAREAVSDDGLFEVIVAKDMSKWNIFGSIGKLYDGSYVEMKKVERFRSNEVYIEALKPEQNVKTEADGELYGNGPFYITMVPKAIRFFVP